MIKRIGIAAMLLAMGASSALAAEATWERWNSDHGDLYMRVEGDLMIGQLKDFSRFELHSAGNGVWKGIISRNSSDTFCDGDPKLGGYYWGNFALTMSPDGQTFTAKADLCGTDKDRYGNWVGALPKGD